MGRTLLALPPAPFRPLSIEPLHCACIARSRSLSKRCMERHAKQLLLKQVEAVDTTVSREEEGSAAAQSEGSTKCQERPWFVMSACCGVEGGEQVHPPSERWEEWSEAVAQMLPPWVNAMPDGSGSRLWLVAWVCCFSVGRTHRLP